MFKVMTIVGTRPELIKMSRVIAELDIHTNHLLVHTGQNYDYELNQIFFEELDIRKPDFFLGVDGESAAQNIAQIIAKSDEVMKSENPDAVMLYGDTNSCLSVISAKRQKIPVFHMEAGNRCFDQRVPEELNRKVLDHLSDINLVLTEHARRYLIAEGIPQETIIKTGSHMDEVLTYYKDKYLKSDILDKLNLKHREYFVISTHREENVDSKQNLIDLMDTLEALADKYNFPVIVSLHPRTAKKIKEIGIEVKNDLIKFLKPFGLMDYLRLQISAKCVVSDSGTITEESSLLNLPAITIRNAHERPEGMDEGTLIMSGLKRDKVIEAIEVVTSQFTESERLIPEIPDYKSKIVSKKIVRIVLSYIDYINRTVWSK
jgi:UDP-N-acetylglucosamine 2-epimerase (non-hydrolysing)